MINIGIIGPEWLREKFETCIGMFPNFNPIYKISNNIYDAATFTTDIEEDCDVILYSSYLAYDYAKAFRKTTVPTIFIPLKGASLYRAYFKLYKKMPHPSILSIDTLTEKDIQTFSRDIDEQIDALYFTDETKMINVEKIITFHKQNYATNKCQAVLTGLKIVSDHLNALQIPNEWIVPTDGDLIVTLERALLATEKRKQLESQIVFGLITIENYEKLKSNLHDEQQIHRLTLEIEHAVLDCVELLEGHLSVVSPQEYLFVTTRGTFERVTEGYKYFPLLANKKGMKMDMNVGVGFGYTAQEAGRHARMAIIQSKEYGEQTCFIVKEDRSVIGPVENRVPITYPLTIIDQDIIEKAEKCSVSPQYLMRVKTILNRKNKETFTANDLASSLGVTTRTTNRMLLKWQDAEIVEIVGVEKLQSRGRPRQVFRFLF